MHDIFDAFAHGTVITPRSATPAETLAWNPSPAFPGVALRHLITGADSNGRFSLHQVRLDPGAEIGEHTHPGNWELHQVIHGSGTLVRADGETAYRPGSAAALPENEPHAVRAGADGLGLLAVFVPPLC